MSFEQFTKIRNILSYNISAQSAYFSRSFGSTKRYLIDKKGEFPTGLLHRVLEFIPESEAPSQANDYRRIPKPKEGRFKLSATSLGCTPYEEQVEAARPSIERGTIVMPTGSGKSITMALLIANLQVKTLVVVPNLQLKLQLTDAFFKYFGSLDNITIENIDSRRLKTLKDYDCLIIDEAHHVAAKTYRQLNKTAWKDIYYRYFFTATPFRSQDEEQLLYESIAGEVIYRLTHKTSVEKGYVVPLEAYYVEIPTKKVEGYTWAQVYSEAVVNNEARNKIIAEIVGKLHANDISTLCLVKEIRHGENLLKLLPEDIPFIKGENEDNWQTIHHFNTRVFNAVLGTTGVVGEGIDTKSAEYVIIAGLGKSKNAFMQQVGRVMRKYEGKTSGKVILIKDKSHKFTLRHFQAQVKILKEEYGITPVKLEI